MAQSSFRKSNYGIFGGDLRADMDGYVHTTIKAVMRGNYDTAGERMTRDMAREIASHNRQAVRAASRKLNEWQSHNS